MTGAAFDPAVPLVVASPEEALRAGVLEHHSTPATILVMVGTNVA